MDAFAIHICSVFMRKRGSRPSAKGRNRFFITAAAKRMRGVFFPMCKTRARSMAGLASRAFGGIRRFHVPLQRKVGGANVRVAVIRLHNAGPKEGAPSFQSAKTVRPVFRGDTVFAYLISGSAPYPRSGTTVSWKNSRAVSGITLYTCPFTETATPLQLHWRMQNVALKSTLSCRLISSIIC